MSAIATPGPSQPPAASGMVRWNTLQILQISRAVVIALVVLLLAAVLNGTRVHKDALKTVGLDTAPSIVAAQHIKAALADMDADAANELLRPAGTGTASVKAYEAHRIEAAEALIGAAKNITYGEAEQRPIQTIQVGLGTYERLVQRARDLHETRSPATVAAYADAASLMDKSLLPNADALDQANNDVLEKTYKSQSDTSTASRGFVVLAALLVLLALTALQLFLSQRMHRTINPFLFLATILTLALGAHAWGAMGEAQKRLEIAKEQAFTSVHALWRARALAYEANSDESRYLLDPANGANAERAFKDHSQAIATVPRGMDLQPLMLAVAQGKHVDGFSGYLAEELDNVTFDGEREAASATLSSWEEYVGIDARIRGLQEGGQPGKAMDLCLGTSPGQSDFVFAQFDARLGATLALNQSAFDDFIRRGFDALGWLDAVSALLAGVIAVLSFLGVAARIREYL